MNKLNNEYLVTVYKGFINKKNIREIHKDIKKVTEYQYKHNLYYSKEQEKYCLKLAKKGVKQYNNILDLALIGDYFYDFLKKEDSYHKMKSFSYQEGKKFEAEEKEKLLKNDLEYNLKNKKIFYLSSSHNDCAEDHKDWQGKIYYDKNWKNSIKDNESRIIVQNYISKNNLKSFQWVTSKPVWFITRPNCRHYFKALSFDEVDSNGVKSLIKKYEMHKKIGGSDTKTISHSLRKEWYNQKNIESIILKYEERLSFNEQLYSAFKSEKIKNAIEKDKFLIKKWKKYLQSKIN